MAFRIKILFALVPVLMLAYQVQVVAADPPAPPPLPPAPPSEPPQPGDVLWTFAQEPPFDDSRLALAIASQVDARIRPTGSRIFYVEFQPGGILAHVSQPPAPAGQWALLLAAAGFPNGLGALPVTNVCRVWSAPAASGLPPSPALSQAAGRLATDVPAAIAALGLALQPCTITENLAEADVIVWLQGGPQPTIPGRRSGFIGLPAPGSALRLVRRIRHLISRLVARRPLPLVVGSQGLLFRAGPRPG